MIVGVDTGALSITDDRLKVGVYRVSVNLLRQLGKLDKQNDYRLYSFLPIEKKLMSEFGPRMSNVTVRPKIGWFSLSIPIELRRHPVDVFLGLSQAMPFGVQKGIGFIYDLGFLHHPEVYQGSAKRLERQTVDLVKRSTKIVAISRSTAEDLQGYYKITPQEITVVYPGIDDRFASTGNKFFVKNPYFLFVGALKKGKNLPLALHAYSNILKNLRIPVDFLVIGGDYWKDPEIGKTIKLLQLEDKVKLLGFVSDSDLPSYYRGALALVVPSLWEGFCLPAVEAMVSGCPVICSNAGALPEIVGPAGLTISPTHEEELIKAMLAVTTDKERRQKMIKEGLVRAKKFSWSTFGKKVLENINRI